MYSQLQKIWQLLNRDEGRYEAKVLVGELMNFSITYTELADRITLALGEQVHSYETTIIKELINENRNEL